MASVKMMMHLMHLLTDAVHGSQRLSVLLGAYLCGDIVEKFWNDHVNIVHEGETRTVHVGCFAPITQDDAAALRTLVPEGDFAFWFDSQLHIFHCMMPEQNISETGPTIALAVSKVLLARHIKKGS